LSTENADRPPGGIADLVVRSSGTRADTAPRMI
jgi:hypothetical protein